LFRKTRLIEEAVYHIQALVLDQLVHNVAFGIFLYYLHQSGILFPWFFSLWIASTIGVILFHNQHTYEPSYVVSPSEWNVNDSGIKGSSFIQVPAIFKYFTGGIEYHHIHHMNSKIPGYHLEMYHNEVQSNPLFQSIVRLSLYQCFRNLWLVLYDDEKKCYVGLDKVQDKVL